MISKEDLEKKKEVYEKQRARFRNESGPNSFRLVTLLCGRVAVFQSYYAASIPCGSMTNFFAAPLSKSLYPVGASSKEMTVTLTAFAIWILS